MVAVSPESDRDSSHSLYTGNRNGTRDYRFPHASPYLMVTRGICMDLVFFLDAGKRIGKASAGLQSICHYGICAARY